MKKFIFGFTITLATFFSACSNSDIEVDSLDDKISKEIRADIDKRFAKFSYVGSSSYDSYLKITLKDEKENGVELIYNSEHQFEAEYREIASFDDLSKVIQNAFYKAMPSNTKIEDVQIFRTQRAYLNHDLYSFCFNNIHQIWISSDGAVVLNNKDNMVNDRISLRRNCLDEYNYVIEHYKGADVRGQVYTGRGYLLLALHNNYCWLYF